MIFLDKCFPLILAFTLVECDTLRDKVFFLQKSSGKENETILVVTWIDNEDISPGCEFFADKDLIEEVLLSSHGSPIRTLSEDEMQSLLGDCTEFKLRRKREVEEDSEDKGGRSTISPDYIEDGEAMHRRRSSTRRGSRNKTTEKGRTGRKQNSNERSRKTTTEATEVTTTATTEATTTATTEVVTEPILTTLGYNGLPVIFPGTKWCGAGALAANYEDLGRYEDTDRCCRDHDLCNDTLAPGETRHNLTNTSSFTKLSCDCDEKFFRCLKKVNSVAANSIGNMYFNILRRRCYSLDHPPSKTCKSYLTLLKLTCLKYEKDTSAPKVYQWVKPKRYSFTKK